MIGQDEERVRPGNAEAPAQTADRQINAGGQGRPGCIGQDLLQAFELTRAVTQDEGLIASIHSHPDLVHQEPDLSFDGRVRIESDTGVMPCVLMSLMRGATTMNPSSSASATHSRICIHA